MESANCPTSVGTPWGRERVGRRTGTTRVAREGPHGGLPLQTERQQSLTWPGHIHLASRVNSSVSCCFQGLLLRACPAPPAPRAPLMKKPLSLFPLHHVHLLHYHGGPHLCSLTHLLAGWFFLSFFICWSILQMAITARAGPG